VVVEEVEMERLRVNEVSVAIEWQLPPELKPSKLSVKEVRELEARWGGRWRWRGCGSRE
jgi:hypothetical protein